jgi:hypothetical protein
MLLPVRDVGLAIVICLREMPSEDAPLRVRVRVGNTVLSWRIKAGGRYGVVAGRLDGHVVGAAWPIAGADGRKEHARSCLPPVAPVGWDVARPWPEDIVSDANGTLPTLSLGITVAGVPVEPNDTDAMIERMAVWRDILHRPAADGVVEWRLGSHAFLVLGDFPSGSRDSRHWGPLGRSALCNRAQPLE